MSAILVRRARRALVPVPSWPASGEPPPGGWPRVSIIVACRDEEAHAGAAVGSFLDLDYPDYQVIAVNDRSTDGTGRVLDELARRSGRLTVVHLAELPPGWLGKTNALRAAAERASGEWLLFTDGDARFHPLLLRRAVEHAVAGGLDLLSLLPRNETRSLWMESFQTLWTLFFINWMGVWAHGRKRQSLVAAGAGAFLLVRRSAYERAGGHASIRLAVVDDFGLSRLLRLAGGRTEIAAPGDWLLVPYAPTYRDLFRVTRKNAFALVGYRWPVMLPLTIGIVVSQCLPFFIFLLDWRLWPYALASWLAVADSYRVLSSITGTRAIYFLLHPLSVVLQLFPWWNSAIAITREGGVSWRGTFYPLRELKAFERSWPRAVRARLRAAAPPAVPGSPLPEREPAGRPGP